MSFTTTTTSSAVAATDINVNVTAATNFAANQYLKIDDEFMKIASSYVSGTIIPVSRGQNGTVVVAHASGANVTIAPISSTAVSDWTGPNASVIASYALSARRRKVASYSASGAISLPVGGEDVLAILNGTTGLTMTVAAPTKDLDGSWLYIAMNGAATTTTINFAGGLNGAGSSYDILTVNTTAPGFIAVMAVNGTWMVPIAAAMTGTVTALTGGIA